MKSEWTDRDSAILIAAAIIDASPEFAGCGHAECVGFARDLADVVKMDVCREFQGKDFQTLCGWCGHARRDH